MRCLRMLFWFMFLYSIRNLFIFLILSLLENLRFLFDFILTEIYDNLTLANVYKIVV